MKPMAAMGFPRAGTGCLHACWQCMRQARVFDPTLQVGLPL